MNDVHKRCSRTCLVYMVCAETCSPLLIQVWHVHAWLMWYIYDIYLMIYICCVHR
jgi:hypothetical protein